MMILKRYALFLSLFFFMALSLPIVAAEDKKYKTISESLHKIADINQIIKENNNDESLRLLIQEKNAEFKFLLSFIQHSFIDYDINSLKEDELELLKSKIQLNRSRGNLAALQRDEFAVDFIMTQREIGHFVVYLVNSMRHYQSKTAVETEVKRRLKALKQTINQQEIPLTGQHKLYQQIATNYVDLEKIQAVYLDFLDYTLGHSKDIITTYFLQKFSLKSAISYVNNLPQFKGVNYVISPLRIDIGGITLSLIILIVTLILFPLISKGSNCLIERFILNDDKVEDVEFVFIAVRKPLLYLVLFCGIDLALNALLYKTPIKPSLDHIIYSIYTLLYLYLSFNLIDSVIAAQTNQSDRRKKSYSKELMLLSIKGLKAIATLTALTLILSHFGINITAILSTFGIGGLAFAMAAKDSLANFFGGLNIMIDRIFKMGDWIQVEAVEGTVIEIGLRSTTIRTFDNALINMPNSLVSTASVLNWNRRTVGRRIKMHIGITYESNMHDVQAALTDIKAMLAQHPDIANPTEKHPILQTRRKHPQRSFLSQEDLQGIKATQLVFLDRYNDFSIDILVYCFSKTVNWVEWLGVKEDVLFKIAQILDKNNLSFAYPTHVQINRPDKRIETGISP